MCKIGRQTKCERAVKYTKCKQTIERKETKGNAVGSIAKGKRDIKVLIRYHGIRKSFKNPY